MTNVDKNPSEINLNYSSTYFTSYQDLEVHQLMLNDQIRTEAYKKAIFSNSSLFQDKVILDVGAGTGILSIFCAQVGARKVYAVEASNIAQIAKEIIKENKFGDIIEVLESRIEDVDLPCKVDVIVSEWMGFYLLHEGMLDSVLFARDKFLADGGRIFPEECILYVAACQVDDYFGKWDDVCGVKMKSFGEKLRNSYQGKPEVINLHESNLICEKLEVCRFNLNRVEYKDLNKISKKYIIPAKRLSRYHGICLWFDVTFPHNEDVIPVILSTSPANPATHWKQTVIVLPMEIEVEEDEPLAWELELQRNSEFSRRYDIHLTMLDPSQEQHPSPCDCYYTKCAVIKAFLEKCENNSENDDYEDLVSE